MKPRENAIFVIVIVIIVLVAWGGAMGILKIMEKQNTQVQPLRLGMDVYKYTIEGHDYFRPSGGGIIHSASCTNHAPIADSTEKAHPDTL